MANTVVIEVWPGFGGQSCRQTNQLRRLRGPAHDSQNQRHGKFSEAGNL
jgi:hypothetical protein